MQTVHFEQCILRRRINAMFHSTRCKEEYECNSCPWVTPVSSSSSCLPPPQWNPRKVAVCFTLNNAMFHFVQCNVSLCTLRELVWMQFLSLGDISLIKQLLFTSSTSQIPNPCPVFSTSANFYVLDVVDKIFYHNRLWQKRLYEIKSSFFVFAKVFLQPPQSCHFSTPWQRKRKLMP